VDIVDTFAAGTGFVRLGNQGRPTRRVFPQTAGQPLIVRLYNTRIARRSFPAGGALVYADALRARAEQGYFTAYADGGGGRSRPTCERSPP
jgi:hypothetical protein